MEQIALYIAAGGTAALLIIEALKIVAKFTTTKKDDEILAKLEGFLKSAGVKDPIP